MIKLIYLKFILDCYYLKHRKSFICLINTIDDWIVYKLFNDNVDQTFRKYINGYCLYSINSNDICNYLSQTSSSSSTSTSSTSTNASSAYSLYSSQKTFSKTNAITKIRFFHSRSNIKNKNNNMLNNVDVNYDNNNNYNYNKMFDNESLIKIKGFTNKIGHFTLDTKNCVMNFRPKLLDTQEEFINYDNINNNNNNNINYSNNNNNKNSNNCNKYNKFEIERLIIDVNSIMKELSIILDTGYLNNNDLSKFPYFGDLINHFTNNEDYINGLFSHESFKWLYNLINLSIYNYLIEYESDYKNKFNIDPNFDKYNYNLDDYNDNDFYHDLIKLRKNFYQKLDPSIRKSLQKRGISIVQNLNTGFDTEYVNIDKNNNKLLSVQFAQVVQNYVKLPLTSRYKLSKINPVTEAVYRVKTTASFDYELLENLIANHIEIIRNFEFDNIDKEVEILIDNLKNHSNIKYFIKDDCIIFKFPLTPERLLIKYIDDNGYSMENLLFDTTSLSIQDIVKSKECLVDIINYYLNHSKSELNIDYIKSFNNTITGLEKLINDNETDNNDSNIKSTKIKQVLKLKRLSRNYLKLKSGVSLSISYYFNNVIIGHNTTADLSILNDFEIFKVDLDIVNKCLVTLGKGLKYNNNKNNIIIRDTMLLAPAGQKSLSSIGKLYNSDKIALTNYEISHMDLLLKNDKTKFKEYALNDSIITLKHAVWMEEFHFKVKGTGIPTTLSNLGNKYVKDY